jgi:hypothetical protein
MSQPQITAEQAEAAVAQMQQEMQSAHIQDLVRKMTEKCFNKCAKTGKGDRLDPSEQSCVALCMDRCGQSPCSFSLAHVGC